LVSCCCLLVLLAAGQLLLATGFMLQRQLARSRSLVLVPAADL
jgi:hypothetical protein